jgi:hypothetical protein
MGAGKLRGKLPGFFLPHFWLVNLPLFTISESSLRNACHSWKVWLRLFIYG